MSRTPLTCALALALLAGCGYDATPPDRAPEPGAAGPSPATPAESNPAPGAQPLLVREGTPGHLADASGAALYYLEGNADGSRCDAACEQVWPPVTSDTPNPVADASVDAADIGTLPGAGGRNHVTWRGHPLYRYAGDRGARTTTGDDVEDQWGRWRLATPGEER
ncbi:putative lipoprotein with Yx(FWY)xxD motif [Luteimonas sp. J16]|jgi:predicted lipoprotein with Yx(FWY)xxD motif|uniref:COG4315 family predicted lipoprotein n=1 Tax=unclassified Luteimonas TaxID=2629088 RepID=UPI0004B85F38|nr:MULTISPECIES: hypothetical protein [unclassified Luteimonas]TWG91159.1 putative lipoprotein with Yx(FWY)xxD motif [Luteimonas sp. J16]